MHGYLTMQCEKIGLNQGGNGVPCQEHRGSGPRLRLSKLMSAISLNNIDSQYVFLPTSVYLNKISALDKNSVF